MEETGITRKQSTMLQGIAILLMMFHHFYLSEAAFPSQVVHTQQVITFAWFGKICVGIFALVSGYGMYYVMQRVEKKSFFSAMGKEFVIAGKRIFSLYLKFWVVLCLTKGLDAMLYQETLDAKEFWRNFFTLEISYNGSWWYLQQYVEMMLLIPFLDLFFTVFSSKKEQKKKRGFYAVVLGILLMVILAGLFLEPLGVMLMGVKEQLRLAYTAVFIVGYLLARFLIFQKANHWLLCRSAFVRVLVGVGCFAGAVFVRMVITKDASQARFDFLIVPFFVYGVVLLLHACKIIGRILYPIGLCSTYMWLLHLWVYKVSLPVVVFWLLPTPWFYLLQVLLSMFVAAALMLLGKLLRKCVRH